MPLNWDLTECKEEDVIPLWVKKKDVEGRTMSAVTEVMIFLTLLVGINKITEKNVKEFYQRVKEFELATGNQGLIHEKRNDSLDVVNVRDRMPTFAEVERHIGLRTNANMMTKKKWNSTLVRIIREHARDTMGYDDEITEIQLPEKA